MDQDSLLQELREVRLEMNKILTEGRWLKSELRGCKEDFLRILETYQKYEDLDRKFSLLILGPDDEEPDEEDGSERFVAGIFARDIKQKMRFGQKEVVRSFTDLSIISKTSVMPSGDTVIGPLHSTQMTMSDQYWDDETGDITDLPMLEVLSEADDDESQSSSDFNVRREPVGLSYSSLLGSESDEDQITPRAFQRRWPPSYVNSPAADSVFSSETLVASTSKRSSRGFGEVAPIFMGSVVDTMEAAYGDSDPIPPNTASVAESIPSLVSADSSYKESEGQVSWESSAMVSDSSAASAPKVGSLAPTNTPNTSTTGIDCNLGDGPVVVIDMNDYKNKKVKRKSSLWKKTQKFASKLTKKTKKKK